MSHQRQQKSQQAGQSPLSSDTGTSDRHAFALVETLEHRRFAEFCDACRRYGYIGLCYGRPGVGKTLSARHYAHWHQVEACSPYKGASDAELAALIDSHTVFYTPKVVNSPRQIAQDIQQWRNRLRAIALEVLRREKEAPLARARQQDAVSKQEFFLQTIATLYCPPSERPTKPESQVLQRSEERRVGK